MHVIHSSESATHPIDNPKKKKNFAQQVDSINYMNKPTQKKCNFFPKEK